jgi:RNA polymerase sigma factor (sigma-70 family)
MVSAKPWGGSRRRRSNGWALAFVHHGDNPKPITEGEGMVDEAAPPLTADDAVRRVLLARIDDAYRLATFILRDPLAAEDAVQEAALFAWDRRKSLRDSRTADGWFTRILVNVCRDELRRRARRPRVIALDPDILERAGPPTRATELGPAIARLTPDEQSLLALRFGRELSIPEIADQLGIPAGTVKSRLHSTLQHLHAGLDAERRAEEPVR